MKYKLRYAKLSVEFNDSSGQIMMKAPKLIAGKDVQRIDVHHVRRIVVGIGTLATMGLGIEWPGGSFWIPTAFKKDQAAARHLMDAVGRSGNMRTMTQAELDGFSAGFTRA